MTKKRTTRKAPAKKRASRKKPKTKARQYVEPKTANELGYLCRTDVDGAPCGTPPVWFDYQLGEVNHLSGFVCDDHRVSNRLEKLKQPRKESEN